MDDSSTICGLLLCVVLPVGLIIALSNSASKKANMLREAEDAYLKSLQKLRRNPNSSEQREATLIAGRQYARLARESNRETVFDEIALMNDMNAIAGQQVSLPSSNTTQASPPPQPLSIEERLARLQKLAEAGHLTNEEYVERRKRLLDEL